MMIAVLAQNASATLSVAMASEEVLQLSAAGDASSEELANFLQLVQDRGAENFQGTL